MQKIKFILLTVLIFGMTSGLSFSADATGKIGYVDLSRLFDEYYKTQDYDQVLETEHSAFEGERNKKIEKIRESQGKLGLLKEDERAKLEEEIEKMKAELLEFDRQKKTDLTKNRNEKIRELLLEIEKVVSTYAESNNYSLILNDRVLIFGNPALNITEPILEKLNAGHSKK